MSADGNASCRAKKLVTPRPDQYPAAAFWYIGGVPTIGFKLLYGFVIVRIDRRDLVWINVTTNPTAEWIARQLTEAFPWDGAPGYMIRDRDRIYGTVVTRRLRAMDIRDKPIAAASPWQNGFAERPIGSIRRECLDHIVVSGEAHLRRILIFRLLQLRQNASFIEQGCANFSFDSTDRKSFVHTQSSAGFTIITSGFEFSAHTLIVLNNAAAKSATIVAPLG